MEVAANLLLIGIAFLAFAAGLPLVIFLRQARNEPAAASVESVSESGPASPPTRVPS